jgi:hypothetical protein
MHPNQDLTTLAGGLELRVTLEDASHATVTLRQFPVREFRALASAIDDEFRLVEIACGQEPGWAGTLSPESYEMLALQMREVNQSFFAWFGRQLADKASMVPPELLEKLVRQGAPSANGLPMSPLARGSASPRPRA